ncbi:MAG: PIN domain-containing protein [Melioribacteraceae bacterium]|nr:PIN domain-containing protein [Melioribacteraceae bacterium]
MKNKKEFLVDTDVLAEHLTGNPGSKTALEKAMLNGTCFTTVLNASELFLACNNDAQISNVDKLLRTLNILGLHARYSLLTKEYAGKSDNVRDALFCAAAKINRLPVLTNKKEKYKFAGIDLVDKNSI